MSRVMKDLQTHIKEVTIDLDTTDYVDFLRELAQWASDEAALAEYREEESDNDM